MENVFLAFLLAFLIGCLAGTVSIGFIVARSLLANCLQRVIVVLRGASRWTIQVPAKISLYTYQRFKLPKLKETMKKEGKWDDDKTWALAERLQHTTYTQEDQK